MTVMGGMTPPLEHPRPLPWLWAAALSAVVGLWIAIGEIDHVLAQILDVDRTWSVSQLTGISSVFNPKPTTLGWEFFRDAAAANAEVGGTKSADVRRWLWEYAALDSALALLYSGLAVAWVHRAEKWRTARRVAA